MTATAPTAAKVRLKSSAQPGEVLAFVALPGAVEVRVRFRRSNKPVQWRCDHCGNHRFSTCPHEIAAAHAIRNERNDP